MDPYLGALIIFLLRICDVSASTLRVIFLVNGRRLPATCLAFCESAIWILAISRVFQHLDSWPNMVGYAGGYACGTLVGITLDQFIGVGKSIVRVITRDPGKHLRERLAAEGFGVTTFFGQGVSGPVQELILVIPRRRRKVLLQHVRAIDPKAFITFETAVQTYGGYHAVPASDHDE